MLVNLYLSLDHHNTSLGDATRSDIFKKNSEQSEITSSRHIMSHHVTSCRVTLVARIDLSFIPETITWIIDTNLPFS